MSWVYGFWAAVLAALVALPMLAGVDIVRRPVTVPTVGLLVLAGVCAPTLAGLASLDWGDVPPDRWAAVSEAAYGVCVGLLVTMAVCTGAAWMLTASRALRPGGPVRWNRHRLGCATIAAVSGPIGVAAGGWEGWATSPASLMLLPVAIGFARDGSERIDRGASVALGLGWVAIFTWELLSLLVRLEDGGGLRWDRYSVVDDLPMLWIVGWSSMAVARVPSPRALVPAVPALVLLGAWLVNAGTAPNPAVSEPGTIPRLFDLARKRARYVGDPTPPCCVANRDGTTDGDCMATFRSRHPAGAIIPTRLPPELPLLEARPYPSWVVMRTDPMFPDALRFRRLDVGSTRGTTYIHLVQYLDRDGLAVVLVNGHPAVNGGAPTLLGPDLVTELLAHLRQLPVLIGRGPVRVEVDPSPHWTVQDMVSMCALRGWRVECGFSR